MLNMFERGISGATFGGIVGGALGTIFTGVVLALPGINIVVAPIAATALAAAAATTVTVSGTAAGTVVGGTVGAISGAKEDMDRRKQEDK